MQQNPDINTNYGIYLPSFLFEGGWDKIRKEWSEEKNSKETKAKTQVFSESEQRALVPAARLRLDGPRHMIYPHQREGQLSFTLRLS